jgi:hypothetical protein
MTDREQSELADDEAFAAWLKQYERGMYVRPLPEKKRRAELSFVAVLTISVCAVYAVALVVLAWGWWAR